MIETLLNYILLVIIKAIGLGIDYQLYLINTLSGLVEIQTRDIVVKVCDQNLFLLKLHCVNEVKGWCFHKP